MVSRAVVNYFELAVGSAPSNSVGFPLDSFEVLFCCFNFSVKST